MKRQTSLAAVLLAAVALPLVGCRIPQPALPPPRPLPAAPPQMAGPPQAPAPPASMPLTFELYAYTNPRPFNPAGGRLAEAIQAELAKAGMDVKLTLLPWGEHLHAIRHEAKGEAYLLGWSNEQGDPGTFLVTHFQDPRTSRRNYMRYRNDQLDALLQQARQAPDVRQRLPLYAAALDLVSRDVPWVPISRLKDFSAVSTGVRGFAVHPNRALYPENLGVEGKQELVYARAADSVAATLDPAVAADPESAKMMNLIYENLYRLKAGSAEPEPWLAEAMPQASADGKTYTIRLRRGIRFHDGTEFNADAVVYSLARQLPGRATGEMAQAEFALAGVREIQKVDDATVQVLLDNPGGLLAANLSMGLAAPIISPTAHKKWGDQAYGDHPVGTGPFRLEKWDKGTEAVFRRFDDYWGGPRRVRPGVDAIIMKVVRDSAVRAGEVEGGEVDVADGISAADAERLRAAPHLQVLELPGANLSYMGLRTDRPPFDDPRVRQAVSMALNRAVLVQALYGGAGEVARGALPGWVAGPAADPWPYDPDRARALLQQAGYPAR